MLPSTGLSFSRPEALLLVLLLVPLAVYLSRTSLALLRRGRRRFSLGLRLVVITLLVLALAGVEVVRAADRLSVVFLASHLLFIDADTGCVRSLQFRRQCSLSLRTIRLEIVVLCQSTCVRLSPGSSSPRRCRASRRFRT